MFSIYDEVVQRVLTNSAKEMNYMKNSYIGTEHLVLSLLKEKDLHFTKKLKQVNVTYDTFKKKIIETIGIGKSDSKNVVYTPLLKNIIEEAEIISKNNNRDIVIIEDIILALLRENEGVAFRVLNSMGIDIQKLLEDYSIKKVKKNNNKKLIVEDFGYDMNKLASKGELDPVIGREKEINQIIEILCRRNKCNPLLIGEAGVGKTAIVEELARRIVLGVVPDALKSKKIISVSMACFVSGTKYRGEFEERITKALSEIENSKDIILFIDEIHTLVGAGGADGAIDASNILKPYLARGKIKIIGATTTNEYKKSIENDRALERRFQEIHIKEPSLDDTIKILKSIKGIYENHHNVIIDDSVIEKIVNYSDKYLFYRKQPDKSIDIMDEVCVRTLLKRTKEEEKRDKLSLKLKELIKEKNNYIISHNIKKALENREKELDTISCINKLKLTSTNRNNKKKVLLDTVVEVINNKINLSILNKGNINSKKTNQLKNKLKKIVIGQDNVVDELIEEVYKNTKKIKLERTPLSFIFAGPPGVGKSYLATCLSKILFNEDNYILLDMNQYADEQSLNKIVGASPGYVGYLNKNSFLDEVKSKSNAIIILDQIEKAHPAIINLFAQILKSGKTKNSNNEEIYFNNNIIIMTTKANFNYNNLGFSDNNNKIKTSIKRIFGNELINTIDKTFVFNYLKEEDIKKIARIEYKNLCSKTNLICKKCGMSDKDIKSVVKESEYLKYGASKTNKVVYKIFTNKNMVKICK